MSYYMSLHTIYAWNVRGGIIEKNCQVLDEQVGFEVRWAIAGTSIVTQVSVSWPEEDGDDRNNDADRANIITRWHKTSSSAWLPYLPAGGPAERGPVHGIWSLWRRRSVQVCTAATFQNAAKTKLESSLAVQTRIQFGRPNRIQLDVQTRIQFGRPNRIPVWIWGQCD